jgi:uncharacterized protein (UPF0261 family)
MRTTPQESAELGAMALRGNLSPEIEVHELDLNINDPAFAEAMAERFDELYQAWREQERNGE